MIKKLTLALLLAAIGSAATAADQTRHTPGFYIGADTGMTKVDSVDEDNSFGVFAGYKFNRFVAVEAGYRDMGKYEFVTTTWNYSTRRYVYNYVDVGMKQTAVSVLGSVPLGSRFSLFARLGYNNLSADVGSVSKNKSGALGGVGAGFAFNPNLSARVEYQHAATDVQNVSAGLIYKF